VTPAPRKGIALESLTWPEAEALFRRTPAPLIVLPVGARTKEHGLHLPLNNDWILTEYLLMRVLDALPVVALPGIPYGYYPAFLEYPGSVSLRREVFRDVVVDICTSISRHGPGKFYVLNTGVSTNWSLEPARAELARLGIHMEYTNLVAALSDAERSVVEQEAGSHADEIETSMMLYIAPEIVKLALAEPDIHPERDENNPGGLTRDPDAARGTYSPTGAWGDPTLATVDKGRVVAEALVTHIVDFLEGFARPDFTATLPLSRYLG